MTHLTPAQHTLLFSLARTPKSVRGYAWRSAVVLVDLGYVRGNEETGMIEITGPGRHFLALNGRPPIINK